MAKIFRISVLVLLCCGLYAAGNTTESNAPEETKKTEVVIIGTIHSAHHKNPNYSPDTLKEIILSLKPDAILNELPLSLVDSNGRPLEKFRSKGSSCPEVWAADEAAMELSIKQIPFDRPDRQENFKKTKYFEREKRANKTAKKWYEQIKKEDPNSTDIKITLLWWRDAEIAHGHLMTNGSPEIINSKTFDSIIRIKHSVWYDILPSVLTKYPGYETLIEDWHFARDQWCERNKIMADNIIEAAKDHPGKRLVIATGCYHRYILRDLLRDEPCVELKEYWEIVKPDFQESQKPKSEKWAPFEWANYTTGGKTYPKAAILIPIQLEHLPKTYWMQLDTGCDGTFFYGIIQQLNYPDESVAKRDNCITVSGELGNYRLRSVPFRVKPGL